MGSVYISVGSNLGDRKMNLETACFRMEEQTGKIIVRSSVYETEPWGFQSADAFLNMVVRIETLCTPEEMMNSLLSIEEAMGRIREGAGYASRVIDLDILMFDARVLKTEKLEIPHPRMHLRKFVLVPMAEIAGGIRHPLLLNTMEELLIACTDNCIVHPYSVKTD